MSNEEPLPEVAIMPPVTSKSINESSDKEEVSVEIIEMRTCAWCNETKTKHDFSGKQWDKGIKNAKLSKCKACLKNGKPCVKSCAGCKVVKPRSEFPEGVVQWCKKCASEKENDPEMSGKKRCFFCEEDKTRNEYTRKLWESEEGCCLACRRVRHRCAGCQLKFKNINFDIEQWRKGDNVGLCKICSQAGVKPEEAVCGECHQMKPVGNGIYEGKCEDCCSRFDANGNLKHTEECKELNGDGHISRSKCLCFHKCNVCLERKHRTDFSQKQWHRNTKGVCFACMSKLREGRNDKNIILREHLGNCKAGLKEDSIGSPNCICAHKCRECQERQHWSEFNKQQWDLGPKRLCKACSEIRISRGNGEKADLLKRKAPGGETIVKDDAMVSDQEPRISNVDIKSGPPQKKTKTVD